MTDGEKNTTDSCGEERKCSAGEGRFAILNQVTFNRAQEDVRETMQVSRGKTVQVEGAASAGTPDFAR